MEHEAIKCVVRAIDKKIFEETPSSGKLSKSRKGGRFSVILALIKQIAQSHIP